jgi:hypothetical protein
MCYEYKPALNNSVDLYLLLVLCHSFTTLRERRKRPLTAARCATLAPREDSGAFVPLLRLDFQLVNSNRMTHCNEYRKT